MSEFGNRTQQAQSEILNTQLRRLLEITPAINSDRDSLKAYISAMRQASPGLASHAGAWVETIRKSIPQVGPRLSVYAESAFTHGNAVMYELLRRVAEEAAQPVPDIEFMPGNIIDTEFPDEEPEWLIDLLMRGQALFRQHPDFFEASLDMFSRVVKGHSVEDLKTILFRPVDPKDILSFNLMNYLNGAAEIVLPIERQAQVEAFED